MYGKPIVNVFTFAWALFVYRVVWLRLSGYNSSWSLQIMVKFLKIEGYHQKLATLTWWGSATLTIDTWMECISARSGQAKEVFYSLSFVQKWDKCSKSLNKVYIVIYQDKASNCDCGRNLYAVRLISEKLILMRPLELFCFIKIKRESTFSTSIKFFTLAITFISIPLHFEGIMETT